MIRVNGQVHSLLHKCVSRIFLSNKNRFLYIKKLNPFLPPLVYNPKKALMFTRQENFS
jgi:hypothetical protein